MASAKKVDQTLHDIIIENVQCGFSDKEIAKRTGLGRSTVYDHRKQWESGIEKKATDAVEEHQLKRKVKELEHEKQSLLNRLEKETTSFGVKGKLLDGVYEVPNWIEDRRGEARGTDDAVAVAFLSDMHLDEVVLPEQVDYVNAFNREIAEKRLKNFFSNTLQLAFDHTKGISYSGLVLPFGGDFFSGNIHEELQQTNEATIIESVLHWVGPIIAGVEQLDAEFHKVHIPCVVGNHGRLTRKPTAKNRAQDNFDFLLYHIVARHFKDNPNVTFNISESADSFFTAFDTRFLLTHGDQFRGGGGIAGLLSPLMVGDHRKRKRQNAVRKPYDYMILGHWHQLSFFKGIIVNGSLKGYDEYASISNFDFEPPQQAFFLVQPEHGITIQAPIHVLDKDESWQKLLGAQRPTSKLTH